MISFSRSLLLATVCAALTAACGSKDSTPASASDSDNADGVQAAGSNAQTSRIEEMLYSPVISSDPAEAASSLAAAQWWPAGCATRAKDATPGVVHISLSNCTGPFGIRQHTGDITVTFSKNADGSLHAQAASSNMTINGKAVTFSRSADITIAGTTRTVHSTGAWTRDSGSGETVVHETDLTTVIDTAARCRTSNGTATTKVGLREVDSTIKDYKLCRNVDGSEGCPSGEVVHNHKLTGKTLTVDFDGSAQAKVTGPKGSVEVDLVCTPLCRGFVELGSTWVGVARASRPLGDGYGSWYSVAR